MTDPKQLHALADEELNPLEANALRSQLKSDPQATAEVDAILNLKDILRSNSLRHNDEEAWKGCLRRLDAIDKSRRVEGFVGRYAWALCGIMFVFIVSGRYAMRNVQGDNARTADLARIFGGSSRASTPETRAESKMYSDLLNAVKQSLDSTEIEVNRPTFGQVRDMPAARYLMRDRKGDLSLVQVDGVLTVQDTAPMSNAPDLESGTVNGANCVVWHKAGQTFLLSGDRSVNDLAETASRLVGTP